MRVLRPAFVVTLAATAAACASQPEPAPVAPTRNPPAQPAPQPEAVTPIRNPPEPACPPRGEITAGAPCAPSGMECYQPTGGCQPSGYVCEGGAWRETPQPTCNPPAPE